MARETPSSSAPAAVSTRSEGATSAATRAFPTNAGFLIDDSDEEVGGKLEDALRAIAGIENVECVSNTVV